MFRICVELSIIIIISASPMIVLYPLIPLLQIIIIFSSPHSSGESVCVCVQYVDLAVHDTVVAHTLHIQTAATIHCYVAVCVPLLVAVDHIMPMDSRLVFFSIIIKPASVSSGTTRYQSRIPLLEHTHSYRRRAHRLDHSMTEAVDVEQYI